MVDHMTFRESEIRYHYAMERKYASEPVPGSRLSDPRNTAHRRALQRELKYCIRMADKLKRAGLPFRVALELQEIIRNELKAVYG